MVGSPLSLGIPYDTFQGIPVDASHPNGSAIIYFDIYDAENSTEKLNKKSDKKNAATQIILLRDFWIHAIKSGMVNLAMVEPIIIKTIWNSVS